MIKGLLILIPFVLLILFIRRKISSNKTGNIIQRILDIYKLITFIPIVIAVIFMIYVLHSLGNKDKKENDE